MFIDDFSPTLVALLGAAGAILASLGVKAFENFAIRRMTSRAKPERSVEHGRESRVDPLQPARQRLKDAKDALSRQKSLATTNRWMSALLTIGQYIIGGLLASSFVQESLTRQTVGILGVLVLLSSLVYQRFRPDIQLRGALRRAMKLKALIRAVEDDLYAIESNSAEAPTVDQIRRRISQGLSEIDASEIEDTNSQIPTKDTDNT
jgi:hypothetical protein